MKWNVYDLKGEFIGIAHGETEDEARTYAKYQLGCIEWHEKQIKENQDVIKILRERIRVLKD